MKNGNYKVIKKKRNLISLTENKATDNSRMTQQYNPQMRMGNQPQMMRMNPPVPNNYFNGVNNTIPNQASPNQGNRGLFLDQVMGGLGDAVGGIAGGAKDAASGAAQSLGANGGGGAALLGAGAGIAMATMGKAKEREELSNLEQDLRSKEMRYFMHINKKNGELDHLEHGVSLSFKKLLL